MPTLDDVRKNALQLNTHQRAELAHDLLLSLQEASFECNAASELAAEVITRSDAVHHGQAVLHDPGESVDRVRRAVAVDDRERAT